MLSVLLWYTDSDYPLGILWLLCCLFLYDIRILITPLLSFGHCVVCSSMISIFWLHPWYLLAIVFSVLLWYTNSDYTLGIFWPLCCLFFYDMQILIIPLVSFGHCVVCSSMIYRFWLHPWYVVAIVFSVLLWYTDFHYTLGIFWPLCFLLFYDIQILITPLVSFGHCVVCSSMIYRFWLHPWYLLAIALSVLLWYTDSDWLPPLYIVAIALSVFLWYTDFDYTLGIFWPLCFLLFYDIQILITPLVSFGHCVVCSSMIYRFWLHPWYLLVIVLSVLLWYTDSDYSLGIFWPLCCLFFYDIQILITPLVYFGHFVVCSSMIYRFWLHPWYVVAIVFSVLLWYTDFHYTLGIFWPLCFLLFYDIQILITPLVSFGHCVVCSSMIYRFWLHPWYLLAIALSVLLWYTDSDWLPPLYIVAIALSVFLWYTDFDYTLGIFWPLCFLLFYDIQILITPLVSFGHCVVCSSMIYRFWLHPWYLLVIVLSVLLWYTDSDYSLGIFWSLCCLFFYDKRILITHLVSFGHCVVCSSMIYRLWLHPWYLLAIVLSVLLWYTDSDYTLGIFWPLCCLFFYDIHILITPLVSFDHCVVCSSIIYRLLLPPWYLVAIVLSVSLWYTNSDYNLGIVWPLCCLFFYDIQILITPLVSFGHCVFCSSMIYRFWLPSCYLLAIVLSVLLWYTDSDYNLGIFWTLCCLFFYVIQILITRLISFGHCAVCSSIIYRLCLHPWYLLTTVLSVLLWYPDSDYPLVSFGHCVVCSSMIYRFWLHPWYLLAIVLSVLLWYTDSDYTLGIVWPLCCLFVYHIHILITSLVSCGHCVVCSSMIYRLWILPWYLLAIVLSVLLWYTDSDYTLGIFWPLCCLFFYDIQILITPLVSFGQCVVCSSMIYRFWLHPWYLLAIVLSVLLWYKNSYYHFDIFWSLCCLFFYDIQILITS